MSRLLYAALIAMALTGAGCHGDEKGVNQNKEKPQSVVK